LEEKPQGDGNWINGGFFVMEPSVIDTIDGDNTVLEREPMEKLARDNQLVAYKHHGFWQPMDTSARQDLPRTTFGPRARAPWKVWEKNESVVFWAGKRVFVTGHTGFMGGC